MAKGAPSACWQGDHPSHTWLTLRPLPGVEGPGSRQAGGSTVVWAAVRLMGTARKSGPEVERGWGGVSGGPGGGWWPVRWLPWGHGSSGGESAPSQEGRKFALIGVGMAAWPPGPHAPHPGRVQEPGLGSDHSGSRWGPGPAVSSAVSTGCARHWWGPVARADGLSPGPHTPRPGGCSVRVRPRWRCYQGCWGPPPGGLALCALPAAGSSRPQTVQPPWKSWDSGPSSQQLP